MLQLKSNLFIVHVDADFKIAEDSRIVFIYNSLNR